MSFWERSTPGAQELASELPYLPSERGDTCHRGPLHYLPQVGAWEGFAALETLPKPQGPAPAPAAMRGAVVSKHELSLTQRLPSSHCQLAVIQPFIASHSASRRQVESTCITGYRLQNSQLVPESYILRPRIGISQSTCSASAATQVLSSLEHTKENRRHPSLA